MPSRPDPPAPPPGPGASGLFPDAKVIACVRELPWVEDDSLYYKGRDTSGRLTEVVAVEADNGDLIITHAMGEGVDPMSTPRNPADYVIGDDVEVTDVDLDTEEVYVNSERLTDERVEQMAEESLRLVGEREANLIPSGKSLSGGATHSRSSYSAKRTPARDTERLTGHQAILPQACRWIEVQRCRSISITALKSSSAWSAANSA